MSCCGPKSFAQSFAQGLFTWKSNPSWFSCQWIPGYCSWPHIIPPGVILPDGPPILGWVFELWKTLLAAAPSPCMVVTDLLKSFCGLLSSGSYILSETSVLLSLLQNRLKILPVVPENNLDSDCRLHVSMMLRGMSQDKQRINRFIWNWWIEPCSRISVSPKKGNISAFMDSSWNDLGRLGGGAEYLWTITLLIQILLP